MPYYDDEPRDYDEREDECTLPLRMGTGFCCCRFYERCQQVNTASCPSLTFVFIKRHPPGLSPSWEVPVEALWRRGLTVGLALRGSALVEALLHGSQPMSVEAFFGPLLVCPLFDPPSPPHWSRPASSRFRSLPRGQAGACCFHARPLRRIHDEDGATVDVVATSQFGQPGQLVVYKTYELRDDDLALHEMVRSEARGPRDARCRRPLQTPAADARCRCPLRSCSAAQLCGEPQGAP